MLSPLVSKIMTLNDLERRNGYHCYFTDLCSLRANYITTVDAKIETHNICHENIAQRI